MHCVFTLKTLNGKKLALLAKKTKLALSYPIQTLSNKYLSGLNKLTLNFAPNKKYEPTD